MDDIDKKIVFLLIKNARLSLQDIADKIGVSKATVGNRLKNLEKNAIIDYKARVDFNLFSMDDVIVGLDIMPEKYIDAIENISRLEFVIELYLTSGDHVAIARIISDKNEVQDKIAMIGRIDGVRKIYPAFVQKIVK
ncbi:MAG: AsnC family transcriptional regulator [Euryarchaeota archaeon]|jgi:Lrp/AsnC family transcriptional regulator for asnA, asnC and gidA|nr:Lrp/AsnC family transcriptional regulator [Thermoplasmata archaeon]MVT36471.1 AsnC family transcriptional regulator [Euryarchaeota archaeon]